VAADQLSESDDESSLAQQSEEEEQESEEEQQEVDEFETAYDDATEDNGLDGTSFEGDDTAVPQDILPTDLTFSWEPLPEDFQRPDNLPDPQYYSGEKGLKRGIANTFETPFESFMRVGGADLAFWRRLTANSNKYARRHCAFCGVHTTFLLRQVEVEIEDDRTINTRSFCLSFFSYFRATIVFLIVLHFITS
jgi:hypothetical protein